MQKKKLLCGALIVAGVIGLAACGGGSSSTSTTAASQINGTAASGAPFAGATITLTDANGTQRSATAGSDGSFTIDVTGLIAPFVIKASGTVGGTTSTYVAVMADAVAAGGTRTLNVTPLTTAVAALLSDNNDPLDMTDVTKLKAKATSAEIKKVVDALKLVLAPVISATGANAATFDPMATAFKADRTGLDSVLDAVKVAVTADGVTLTNAFAPTQESSADPTAPATPSLVLTKNNLTTSLIPLPAPSVTVSTVATIVDKWRDQLDACFALPAADRVTTTTVNGSTYVTGVKGACAQISGFDASYKSYGYNVVQRYGYVLIDPAMDGAKFGVPEILTLIKTETGDDLALFRLPFKRSDGDTNHVVDVAKRFAAATAADSGWRVIGNQLDYDASVEARMDRVVDVKNGNKTLYISKLRLYFNPLGPNASDVNTVKITGPGLPDAGVVLGKSDSCGTADYLSVTNKIGNTNVQRTTNTSSYFGLDAAYADGAAFSWPGTSIDFASAPVDVSTMKPLTRYKFEVYRADNSKKGEFYTRITAAPLTAKYGSALQWNELSTASLDYLNPTSAKAGATATATIDWTRNALAAPVEHINIFGKDQATGARVLAQKSGIKHSITSVTVNAQALGSSFGGTICNDATIPSLNVSGNRREITLRSRNASDVRQYATWTYTN